MVVAVSAFAAPVPDTGQTKCYDVAGNVRYLIINNIPHHCCPGNFLRIDVTNYNNTL
jgi:hypothetical protein